MSKIQENKKKGMKSLKLWLEPIINIEVYLIRNKKGWESLAKTTQIKPQIKLLMWGLNGNSEFQNSEIQTLSKDQGCSPWSLTQIIMAPLTKMCLINPSVMCQEMGLGRVPRTRQTKDFLPVCGSETNKISPLSIS